MLVSEDPFEAVNFYELLLLISGNSSDENVFYFA